MLQMQEQIAALQGENSQLKQQMAQMRRQLDSVLSKMSLTQPGF